MKKIIYLLLLVFPMVSYSQEIRIGINTNASFFKINEKSASTFRVNPGFEVSVNKNLNKLFGIKTGFSFGSFQYHAEFPNTQNSVSEIFINNRLLEIPVMLSLNSKKHGFNFDAGISAYGTKALGFNGKTKVSSTADSPTNEVSFVNTEIKDFNYGISPKMSIGKYILKNKIQLELSGVFNIAVPDYTVIRKLNGDITTSTAISKVSVTRLGFFYKLK
ncbi:MAG: outer membrane beta-barrel protein [Spirosomataceae bacterium]|jgi:hypothetical protein